MYLKQAISKRIIELCELHQISPNRLAELSAIPPTNLKDILAERINNPSTVMIYKICNTLKMNLKDFYDSPMFEQEFDD